MTLDDAMQLLRQLEGFVRTGGPANPGMAHFATGLSIEAGPGRDGRIETVEIYRPGDQLRDVVTYRRIEVLAEPAADVIRQLQAQTRVLIEEGGRGLVAPDLPLGLWRATLPDTDNDEDGQHFLSVLVGRAGYYDPPAD
jgi:hypothetical protein